MGRHALDAKLATVEPARRWARIGSPRAGFSQVGQRAARLSERWPALSLAGSHEVQGSRLSTRAQGRGSLVAAPSNWDCGKWTPRPRTSLFCLRRCRSFAQPSPGLRITLFSARSLPHLLLSPFSASPQGSEIEDVGTNWFTTHRESNHRFARVDRTDLSRPARLREGR
jgi:hypothetical protein